MILRCIVFLLMTIINGYHLYVPKSSNKWYVIGESKKFEVNKPNKITLNNIEIAVWRDNNNRYSAVHNICPHRGASLSAGRIDSHTGCIVCPYHTFKFNNHGRLVQTPGSEKIRTNEKFILKTDVPYFDVLEKGGWVFLKNEPKYEISMIENDIWIEPEAYDSSYRCVYLDKKFNVDSRTLTENSLDILHISEVHTFGNPKRPLPISDHIEKINDEHYKIVYEYEAGDESLAKKVFGENTLIVENEFILPHYTIARVKFGLFVNTIVTSALPVNENESILYVKAYRNNFVSNTFWLWNELFDTITKSMMEKTLKEDKRVIETIKRENAEGKYLTKYDEMVKKYRESIYE